MNRRFDRVKVNVPETPFKVMQVDAMIEETISCVEADPEYGLHVIEETILLAREEGYKAGEGLGMLYRELLKSMLGAVDINLTQALEGKRILEAEASSQKMIAKGAIVCGRLYGKANNFSESIEYFQEACDIADRVKDKLLFAESLCGLSDVYRTQGNYDKTLHNSQQALSMVKVEKKPLWSTHLYVQIVDALRSLDRYDEAIEYINKGLSIAQKQQNVPAEINLYTASGLMYGQIGKMDLALESLLKGLSLEKQLKRPLRLAALMDHVASLYYALADYPTALRYAEQSEEIVRTKSPFIHCQSLITLATIHHSLNNNKTTRRLGLQALQLARDNEFQLLYANSLFLLGRLSHQEEDWKDASTYYQEALSVYREGGAKRNEIFVLNRLALLEIEREEGDIELALISIEQAKTLAEEINSSYALSLVTETYAKIYERQGTGDDLATALAYRKRSQELESDVIGPAVQGRIRSSAVQSAVEEKEQQLRSMAEVVDEKERQLTTASLQLASQRELLVKAKKRIKRALKGVYGTTKPQLMRLLHDLEESGDNESTWQEFEKKFHTIYADFIPICSAQWPDLSVTELKVCSLLRMGLSTKEIATFLHVTHRAIDKHRNSIRKKVGLQPRQNLVAFFAQVSY